MQLSGLGFSCFISTSGLSEEDALEPKAKGKQESASEEDGKSELSRGNVV